jgi:hypothetical protein
VGGAPDRFTAKRQRRHEAPDLAPELALAASA